MAKKINLLVDTDVFIDYFNHRLFKEFFESENFRVYYSVVTKKELLSKEGLSRSEELEIRRLLRQCRIVPLDSSVLEQYGALRQEQPSLAKEDCLIAATAIVKRLLLATRNIRHYQAIDQLQLYFR